jgi:hypothetical protein
MNVKNVKKREILDYKQFLEVTADPFNKKNLSKEDRTGFHKIKPEKPYAYVGWQDPIFKKVSKIDYPGRGATESGTASEFGTSE